MLFKTIADQWLDQIEKANEENPKKNYVRSCRYMRTKLHFFDGYDVTKINDKVVSDYLDNRGKLAKSTAALEVTYIRMVLQLAVDEGHLPAAPQLRRSKLLKKRLQADKASKPKNLTQDQVNALWSTLEKPEFARLRPIVALGFYAGLRIDEIVNLKWSDVSDDFITIQPKEGWNPKSNRSRHIPVSDRLGVELSKWQNGKKVNRDDHVCTMKQSKPRGWEKTHATKCLKELWQKAGIYQEGSPVSHALRHTFASTVLEKGATLVNVKEMLGHADISTTSRYLHGDLEGKLSALNKL